MRLISISAAFFVDKAESGTVRGWEAKRIEGGESSAI